jgi:hypothetical protein
MRNLALLLTLTLASALVAAPAPAQAAPAVCSVFCDTRDPSLARQDSFPVPEVSLNGRRLVLHVSDADGMAWGSIDNGVTGDSVWLDRTWTDGSSWDGLLGRASIPGTWTGTRTLMYNMADPAGHRRGMVRACGDAGGVTCTAWAHVKVCEALCDASPASSAVGDQQLVPLVTLSGRRIELHVDTRGLAWGVIANGAAGDEIWLDRSWNEGASWPGGSSLGRLSVPGGANTARTGMFNTRDTRSVLYGGSVRACGRAVTGANSACTAWARPAASRTAAAAEALAYSYRPDTAWWPSSWWNSAVAVTTLGDYSVRSGRTDFRWLIDRTFEVNKGVFPAGVKSSDPIEGNFISRAIDDTGWWALAWIQAYDLTREAKYLSMATTIGAYMHSYWDTSSCGGGVWWDRERTYKNAVTIGLYIRLAAALHNRIPGDTVWLNRATTGWNWFTASGMINPSGLVNDGINSTCGNNGQTVWTYNQGLAIGAAVELWRANGNASLLTKARQLADAAIASATLTRNGILTESCDPTAVCDDNQKQFKGIFIRYLREAADAANVASYRAYTQRQADTIWQSDRDSQNRLGLRWAGGTPNATDWRTQASALSALLSA